MWKSILKILIIFHLLIGLAVDEKCVEKLFVANTKFSLQIKSGNHSNINLLLENIQNEVVNFCILQLISYGISSAFRVCRSLEGRLLLFFKYFTTIEINPLFHILFVYFLWQNTSALFEVFDRIDLSIYTKFLLYNK